MRTGQVLVLCTAVLLASCHGDSYDPNSGALSSIKHGPAVKRGPTPEEMTVGMVEAVTEGKSTVPVNLKFDLSSRPIVGRPVEVSVAVMPQIEADAAVLTISGPPGVQLPPGFAPIEIANVDPSQVYRHTVTVTPTQDGVQLLLFNVMLKHDETSETRVFEMPLVVSTPAEAANTTTPTSVPGGP